MKPINRLRVHSRDLSGRGAARAEDAQGTPTQRHISPSTLVDKDELFPLGSEAEVLAGSRTLDGVLALLGRVADGVQRHEVLVQLLGPKPEIHGDDALEENQLR